MKARRLIVGAAFGPDALKAIGEAFDAAWSRQLWQRSSGNRDARYSLANALLSMASEDNRDVEVLKQAALERMALDYRKS
jgi:hypothetical protein